MFQAEEMRKILDSATQPLKAMILLGINCGFGATDISNLPLSAIDFKGGWVDFPRPKTEIAARCPLWPETVKARGGSYQNPTQAERQGRCRVGVYHPARRKMGST